MTTTLDRIRAKCVEANPSIARKGWVEDTTRREPGQLHRTRVKQVVKYRTIRLADVLLAMWKFNNDLRTGIVVNEGGQFLRDTEEGTFPTGAWWNLREDDLEKQSPECQEFIANVLGV